MSARPTPNSRVIAKAPAGILRSAMSPKHYYYTFFVYKYILFLTACAACFSGCSGNPPATGLMPYWIRQNGRSLEGQRIVFVESDDHLDRQKAQFLAEAQALADLANECSFVPKGAKIDGRFENSVAKIHQYFVKVSVDQAVCQAARQAQTQASIEALADSELDQVLRKFHSQHPQPDLSPANDEARLAGLPDGAAYFIKREKIAQIKLAILRRSSSGAKETPNAPEQASLNQEILAEESSQPEYLKGPTSWATFRRLLLHSQAKLPSGFYDSTPNLPHAPSAPRPAQGARPRAKVNEH